MDEPFDKYVKLAELAIRRFETRRAYEWKILLGFWAAMLAVFSPAWNAPRIESHWLVLAIGLFIVCWVAGVWVANSNDKQRYEYYLKKAETLAGIERTKEFVDYPDAENRIDLFKRGPGKQLTNMRLWEFVWDWNVQFQVLGTIAIAILICSQQDQCSPSRKGDGRQVQSIGTYYQDEERIRSLGWLELRNDER